MPRTEKERAARLSVVWDLEVAEVDNPNRPWWWLSFADSTGFRGAVIIQAMSFEGAILRAIHLKVNPGGEVEGSELHPERMEHFPQADRNRCLSKDEARWLAMPPWGRGERP